MSKKTKVADLTVSKDEITDIISAVKNCTLKSNTIPILEYICFRDNKVKAFNGSTGIEVSLEHPFDFCVKADLFSKIINSYADNTITFSYDEEAEKLSINTSEIVTVPSGKFLTASINHVESEEAVILNELFIDALKFVLNSSSTSTLHENINGVIFDFKDNTLELSATNRRLFSNVKIPFAFGGNRKFLLSEEFCSILLKIVKLSEFEYTLSFFNDAVFVSGICEETDVQEILLYTKINKNLKLIDIDSVLSMYPIKEDDMSFEFSDDLDEIIKRASIVSGKSGIIVLEDDGDDCIIFKSKSTMSKAKDRLKVALTAKKLPKFKAEFDISEFKSAIDYISKFSIHCESENNITVCSNKDGRVQLISSIN